MPLEKIETASKTITYTASIGGSVGTMLDWITANQALAMFFVAIAGYLTNILISIWYKRRLLVIAEKEGVRGADE